MRFGSGNNAEESENNNTNREIRLHEPSPSLEETSGPAKEAVVRNSLVCKQLPKLLA
jgi:hypothetical protein